jgi:hypothetical protein
MPPLTETRSARTSYGSWDACRVQWSLNADPLNSSDHTRFQFTVDGGGSDAGGGDCAGEPDDGFDEDEPAGDFVDDAPLDDCDVDGVALSVAAAEAAADGAPEVFAGPEDKAVSTLPVNGRPRPYADQSTWTGLAGVAYLPAAVAPAGLTRSGLPVGVQVVAPYLEDRTAVDVARHLERVLGGYRVPPLG